MPSIYKKLFALFYDSFMLKTERGLYKKRKALIEPLRGRILEVGSGTGINYQFYSKDAEIFALDPNKSMLKRAEIKAPQDLLITYLNHKICDEEISALIKQGSLDAIVSTLVLCSVPDPKMAIERFKYWLKPEGKLIILEHIHASNPLNKQLQNLINPVWRPFSDGCNLNRNTDVLLEQGGFTAVESEYFVQSLRWVMGNYQLNANNI
jgi:ubiquinone/menaquinone biosynthesis C-methylase UbiE